MNLISTFIVLVCCLAFADLFLCLFLPKRWKCILCRLGEAPKCGAGLRMASGNNHICGLSYRHEGAHCCPYTSSSHNGVTWDLSTGLTHWERLIVWWRHL